MSEDTSNHDEEDNILPSIGGDAQKGLASRTFSTGEDVKLISPIIDNTAKIRNPPYVADARTKNRSVATPHKTCSSRARRQK